MRNQKCSLKLYTDFLISNQNRYSGIEFSKALKGEISHDNVARWPSSSNYTPLNLWRETKNLVSLKEGELIGDDSLVAKKYSKENELACQQYSGNDHGIANGICIVNLLWTKGEEFVPVDYRIEQKENDGKTK